MAKPKGGANGRLVPGVGTMFELNWDRLHYAENMPTMARIAYNHDLRSWEMQNFVEDEGLVVFFRTRPENGHTKATIENVLSTQTACYASSSA